MYDVAFQERVMSAVLSSASRCDRVCCWWTRRRVNSMPGLGLKFPIIGTERNRSVDADRGLQGCRPCAAAADSRRCDGRRSRSRQTQVRKKKGRPDIVFDSLIDAAAGAIARGERLGPYVGWPLQVLRVLLRARGSVRRRGAAAGPSAWRRSLKEPVKEPREVSVFGLYGRAEIERAHRAEADLDARARRNVTSRSRNRPRRSH